MSIASQCHFSNGKVQNYLSWGLDYCNQGQLSSILLRGGLVSRNLFSAAETEKPMLSLSETTQETLAKSWHLQPRENWIAYKSWVNKIYGIFVGTKPSWKIRNLVHL